MASPGIHPIANLLPGMSPEQESELFRDIKRHGLRERVVLFEGMILDGRHRARCWYDLHQNHDFPTTTFEGSAAEAVDFVRSYNVKRRHLRPGQIAAFEAAAEEFMKPKRAGRPKKNGGNSPITSQRQIAAAAGVDRKTIRDAAKVIKNADPVVTMTMREGKVSVGRALAISKLPKGKQLAALNEPRRAPAKGKAGKLDPQAEAFNRGVEAAAQFVDDNGDDALAHAIRERCLKRRRV